MRLVVLSHKVCWASPSSPRGYATDGGFAKQMSALAELFDQTTVCVPVTDQVDQQARNTGSAFEGDALSIRPLPELQRSGRARRHRLPFWSARALPTLVREVAAADAVHAPIPGDIGTYGIVLAELFRRPLLVRYCGNWFVERTRAERSWHWYMRRFAGGRRVMLATGGAPEPPCPRNPALEWIFSASLRADELPDAGPHLKPSLDSGLRLALVGRQEPYKGTGAVIEALPTLLEHHPSLHFDVFGDGSGLDGFRRLAADIGVGDHVTFHGNTDHGRILEALVRSHVFVFPTESEGFPKVVAEALACGTPVVTSPVSVLATLITDEVGRLLPANEPVDIAEAVLSVCDDRYAERSANAVELGRSFTLDRWRDEIGARLRSAWGPAFGRSQPIVRR